MRRRGLILREPATGAGKRTRTTKVLWRANLGRSTCPMVSTGSKRSTGTGSARRRSELTGAWRAPADPCSTWRVTWAWISHSRSMTITSSFRSGPCCEPDWSRSAIASGSRSTGSRYPGPKRRRLCRRARDHSPAPGHVRAATDRGAGVGDGWRWRDWPEPGWKESCRAPLPGSSCRMFGHHAPDLATDLAHGPDVPRDPLGIRGYRGRDGVSILELVSAPFRVTLTNAQ
jgi:hypothetical protein